MPLRIALIGAGAISRTHLQAATETPEVQIVALADPNPAAQSLAEAFGIPWRPDHHAVLAQDKPQAAIVATPNALHVPVALDCIAADVAVLVEKPIADTLEAAQRLCAAAEAAGVALLVGHHRRHNPIIRQARALIGQGALGRIVAVSALALFLKPDAYFDIPWRSQPGGGPVLINLIHEIDLLRHLCGEIVEVQAVTANNARGLAVEDTAATILRFAGGAVATITLSDSTPSPWSWDLVSGESPVFYQPKAETHFICGTEGGLALPTLNLWCYPGSRGWDQALATDSKSVPRGNPYAEQLRHFAAVVRGEEAPLTSGPDGARTLAATLAVKQAAETGAPVAL
jgi:predicted dehydrogenase